jgi:nicotinamidase-related amidase
MIDTVPPAGEPDWQAEPAIHARIPPQAVHLCLDMQNLIGPVGPWAAQWAERVMPTIVALIEHAPARTLFTRFVPPPEPDLLPGAWRDFYRKWPGLTGKEIDLEALELMAPLKLFIPPATVIDKTRYSAFSNPALQERLKAMSAQALIVSGAESDMCVLSTVLAAVDLGYPVVVATDAICSASDPCHDAVLRLYHQRFSQQVQTMTVAAIREAWAVA